MLPMLVKRPITVSGMTRTRASNAKGANRINLGSSSTKNTAPANSRPSQAPREKVSSIHTHISPQQISHTMRLFQCLAVSRQAPPKGMIRIKYCPSILGLLKVEGTRKVMEENISLSTQAAD